MVDWNQKWFEGEEPKQQKKTWKTFIRQHQADVILSFLLSAALLVWYGVS